MTTNSPKPVDGDAQAQPVAWAHRLVNKRNGTIHPWVYGSNEKEPSEGDIFRIEVKPLYDTPPARLLRPVELPDIKTARSDWSAWNWIEHLGGRFQNGQPGDYIEFGSVYAVAQMLKQYRRTVTAEVIAEIAESLRKQGYEVKND